LLLPRGQRRQLLLVWCRRLIRLRVENSFTMGTWFFCCCLLVFVHSLHRLLHHLIRHTLTCHFLLLHWHHSSPITLVPVPLFLRNLRGWFVVGIRSDLSRCLWLVNRGR